MGITNSKSDQQTLNIDNRFRVVEQVPDRNVSLLEERDTGRPYVLKEITFNDKEEFGKALTRVATKQKALEGDPHVVPLTGTTIKHYRILQSNRRSFLLKFLQNLCLVRTSA